VTRSVSVSVTNVDVVVTDSSGKPINDLTAGDFEVRQDGKLQPITNFSFVSNPLPSLSPVPEHGQAPPPAIVPRDAAQPAATRAHLIVFLDELHLTSVNRNRALTSLKEYLPTVVGPNVDVQFVTWDRSLRIRGPFINEAPLVGRMLSELEQEATLGNALLQERMDLIREIDEAFNPTEAAGNRRSSGRLCSTPPSSTSRPGPTRKRPRSTPRPRRCGSPSPPWRELRGARCSFS
jgi:VWFA-related protein